MMTGADEWKPMDMIQIVMQCSPTAEKRGGRLTREFRYTYSCGLVNKAPPKNVDGLLM